MTLSLVIILSGILAYLFARIITKPLENLEKVASQAAEGDLNQTINIQQSDDEIKALSLAFDKMLKNIKLMIEDIKDRKSTRLNSSHVAISYAALCLNKKRST